MIETRGWISALAGWALVFLLSNGLAAVEDPVGNEIPDLTRGGAVPQGANHDWTLGATGTRGWMYSDKLETTEARQIAITQVDPDSPAAGVLEVGDVILGVGGQPFSTDPRTELGEALVQAESEAGGGILSLIRWRNGETREVTLSLPVLGTYSATAPYDCPKSRRIFEQGCQALAKRIDSPSYRLNPIPRSLNALALLASGDPEYLPLVRREAEWAAGFSADGFQTWYYGFVILFLSEYVIETGDDSVLPGLRRLALEAAAGQSAVGSWGHRFAGPDGRLQGYGMMNAPGLPLTTALILARKAGVNDLPVERAIENSIRMLRFYVGKGSIPYGDHRPWIQTHEDNGKNGIAALMFRLLGDTEAAEYFSRMSLASHGSERDTGHTGNFFNILWALPGVAQLGPHATGAWMEEFGARYFDLARRWDGTFLHQGPPALKRDKYPGWDCTGVYLLAYAMPLKNLYLTGKGENPLPPLDRATAERFLDDGRGWSNRDRFSHYDGLNTDQLITRLSSWSPVVRERAAIALSRRQDDIAATLIGLLTASDLETRYGACQALKLQGKRGAAAVPALRETLHSEDLWLRIVAAEALAGIGEPARTAVPEMLIRFTQSDPERDPRGMEQRYLCFALFNRRDGLVGRSLEAVDRELLIEAVRAGLHNEDGRARGSLGSVYENLTFEEIQPLLPAIYEAIVEPAPSGIMFASGIRLAGLDLLARHRIREGLPLCLEVMEIDKWGKKERIARCLKSLARYGAAAKPMLPRMRQIEQELAAHREAKGLQAQIAELRSLINEVENAADTGELRSLQDFGL